MFCYSLDPLLNQSPGSEEHPPRDPVWPYIHGKIKVPDICGEEQLGMVQQMKGGTMGVEKIHYCRETMAGCPK